MTDPQNQQYGGSFVKRAVDSASLMRHAIQFILMICFVIVTWRDLVNQVNAADQKNIEQSDRIKTVEDAVINLKTNQAVIKEKLETEQHNNEKFRDNTSKKLDEILQNLRNKQ
jgi:hypothetical protein